MTQPIKMKCNVRFDCGRNGRKHLRDSDASSSKPILAGRVPLVSRLMALAIRLDGLIRDGLLESQADVARLGQVSRARVTQILNLLNLAPDIQEELLFLPLVEGGRDPLSERDLRSIATVADWRKQRRMWRKLAAENRLAGG